MSFRRKKQYVKTYVKNCSYYIINMVTIQLQSNKARDSFNVTLLSDTHTLKIQYEYSHSSVGVAKEGNIKRAPGLI